MLKLKVVILPKSISWKKSPNSTHFTLRYRYPIVWFQKKDNTSLVRSLLYILLFIGMTGMPGGISKSQSNYINASAFMNQYICSINGVDLLDFILNISDILLVVTVFC